MSRAPRTSGPRRAWAVRGLAVGVIALLALAGCGGNDNSENSSADQAPSEAGSGGASREGPAGENAVTAEATRLPAGSEQADDQPEQIIYTGSITLQVDDRRKAADEATKIAEDHGGNRFSLEADLSGDGDATLVLKVEPEEFDEAMADLAELGKPRSTKVDQENVTDEVVDVQGRLETATRSADRLRELLTTADDVSAIVVVEQELARRESEIESLEGQLRVLESRTSMATITVTLTERNEAEVNKDIPGFGTGLSNGVVAMLDVLAVGLTVLGFVLPFLLLLAPFLAGWWFWRRRHPKKPKAAKPAATPAMYWDGTQWRPTASAQPNAPATVGAPAAPSPVETTGSSSATGTPASDPDAGPTPKT